MRHHRLLSTNTNPLRLPRPPIAHIPPIPLHRLPQALRERHPLAPAQGLQFLAADVVIVVVEGAVGDPDEAAVEVGLRAVVEELEHADGDFEVRDCGGGVEVVGFAHEASVEEGVEAVGGVGGVEVAADVEAGALDCEGLVVGEEGVEAGDDFWRR